MKRAGFTLIELLVVIGIIGVVGAIAALAMPASIKTSKADSAMFSVIAEMRRARETAVTLRRDVEVRFVAPSEIQLYQCAVSADNSCPTASVTLLRRTFLENGFRYVLFSSLPDTPDAFGKTSAVYFGSSTRYIFRSEGTLTDTNSNLDPISGTIFIGLSGQSATARAITLFGPSALVRGYKWDGRTWTE
jgi:prepilin-type N-terminal cleavage/methylation domain-containing protein